MGSGTEGSEKGTIVEHPNWMGNWCNVMYHGDSEEETWTAGNTVHEVYYYDGQGDGNGFNRYIAEMTIPWIGIQMNNESLVRYQHSEVTNVYYFLYVCYTVIQYGDDQYFSIEIRYELDMDNDSSIDWEVLEKIETWSNQGQEDIKIELGFLTHPAWSEVARVDIPFRIDPDVYDTPTNNIYCPNAITTETAQAVAGGDPTVKRTDPGNEHDIDIIANTQGMNPSFETYYFLLQQETEYSQDPSSYNTNENIEDNNVVIWYVQSYQDCDTDAPPEAPGEWTGIYCDGFEA